MNELSFGSYSFGVGLLFASAGYGFVSSWSMFSGLAMLGVALILFGALIAITDKEVS